VTVASGAEITFVRPVREGDLLVARAQERTIYGRSGIYDVTVKCGDEVVAEFRGGRDPTVAVAGRPSDKSVVAAAAFTVPPCGWPAAHNRCGPADQHP
jgi:acyl-CoA thioesterase FadM